MLCFQASCAYTSAPPITISDRRGPIPRLRMRAARWSSSPAVPSAAAPLRGLATLALMRHEAASGRSSAPPLTRQRRARLRQRSRRARSRNHQTLPATFPSFRSAICSSAVDVLPQPRHIRFPGGSVRKNSCLQPHRAQRHAHHLANAPLLAERYLAASAAQVDHHASRLRPRYQRHHPQVDQPALFQSRDHLHLPARSGFHPRRKRRRVARIAHGAGRHNPHPVRHMQLHRLLEPFQRANRIRHRVRRDHPRLEHALAPDAPPRGPRAPFSGRCCCTVAIFSRTEFEPISIAANVSIRKAPSPSLSSFAIPCQTAKRKYFSLSHNTPPATSQDVSC